MYENLIEAYEAINTLNEKLWGENGDKNEELSFSLTTNGLVFCIGFMEFHLWNSDDEPREFNEDSGLYEDLTEYCLLVLNQKIKKFNEIQIK